MLHRRFIAWGPLWVGLAGIARGLTLICRQYWMPSDRHSFLSDLPHVVLWMVIVGWIGAGVWALVSAFWTRLGAWPSYLVTMLATASAVASAVSIPAYGSAAVTGVVFYVIFAGLTGTRARVAVVKGD